MIIEVIFINVRVVYVENMGNFIVVFTANLYIRMRGCSLGESDKKSRSNDGGEPLRGNEGGQGSGNKKNPGLTEEEQRNLAENESKNELGLQPKQKPSKRKRSA